MSGSETDLLLGKLLFPLQGSLRALGSIGSPSSHFPPLHRHTLMWGSQSVLKVGGAAKGEQTYVKERLEPQKHTRS